MTFTYFFSLIASFIGIFAGIFISVNAREELAIGKKYFLLIERIILAIILGLVLYFYGLDMYFALGVSLVAFAVLHRIKLNDTIIFLVLGIAFFLGRGYAIVVSLIFLYGMAAGSLLTSEEKKSKFWQIVGKALRKCWYYLIVAALLGLIF